MIKLIVVGLVVFVFNIPFGYWRANVRKFSAQWILAIHIPVPFIVALRVLSGVGFSWYTYVFMVLSFFLGQKIGSLWFRQLKARGKSVSSCLLADFFNGIL
jgi:hypothetical protein